MTATPSVTPSVDATASPSPTVSELSEPDLPAGVYTVTGHYDDPAAATCEGDPEVGLDPVAQIGACRMTLVITHIEPFEG